MNEKELQEVKRTLSPEKNAITSVKGCYINAEGRIITRFERSFGLIEEAETEKYIALFKRTLSGGLQKNLIDIAFSSAQVTEGEEYRLLSALKKSKLEDEEALTAFYEKVASSIKFEDNYVVLLLSNSYDIPYKAKDGADSEGAGEVYSYILCALCPVKAGKAGLSYAPAEKTFINAGGEGLISAPVAGFLFPAFDGRQTNIYNALFYTKSTEALDEDFLSSIFGKTPLPMPAAEQSRAFREVIAESLNEECSFDVVKDVHLKLCEKIEEHKEARDPEPLLLTKEDLKSVLTECGVAEEKLTDFSENYNESFGATADLAPKNLVNPNQFELRTADVVVKVAPGHSDLVSTKIIDGVKYILVRADGDLELNGLAVKIEKN